MYFHALSQDLAIQGFYFKLLKQSQYILNYQGISNEKQSSFLFKLSNLKDALSKREIIHNLM